MSPLMKFEKIYKAESEVKLNKNVEENMKFLDDVYIKNAIMEYIEFYQIKEEVNLSNHYLMIGFIMQELFKQIHSSL